MVADSALKNTQAKTVKKKVMPIENNSFTLGSKLFSATTSVFFLFLFVNNKGKKYMAFNAPQMIKVQLAPCQKPLTVNMIKVFRTFIKVLPLLPPNGIYK